MSNYDNAERLTELTDMGAHELAKRVMELERQRGGLAELLDSAIKDLAEIGDFDGEYSQIAPALIREKRELLR